MYAKLIVGSTVYTNFMYMRDIVKLCTSNTPNLSVVAAFSNVSSVIVDQTPAGWTYVGSTYASDRNGIQVSRATAPTGANNNLVMSANCADPTLPSKFVTLTSAGSGTGSGPAMTLTVATNAANTGVTTNETGKFIDTQTVYTSQNIHLYANTGDVWHVFSTPRHVTICVQGKGVMGAWEASPTDLHYFYGIAPQVSYNHGFTLDPGPLFIYNSTSNIFGRLSMGNSSLNATDVAGGYTIYGNYSITVPTLTDPNTSNTYTAVDLTDVFYNSIWNLTPVYAGVWSGINPYPRRNIGNLYQNTSIAKFNKTINQSGQLRYLIAPIYFSVDQYGYATQFVSGVSPIYFAKSGIAVSGDQITINGNQYYYVDLGGYALAITGS